MQQALVKVYCFYSHYQDFHNEFEKFKEDNQLTIPYKEFASSLQSLFENSVKDPQNYECKFVYKQEEDKTEITFFQKLRRSKLSFCVMSYTKMTIFDMAYDHINHILYIPISYDYIIQGETKGRSKTFKLNTTSGESIEITPKMENKRIYPLNIYVLKILNNIYQ